MEAVAQAAGLDLYRAAFDRLEEERRGEAPWLRKLRNEAMERFLDLGFPTTKVEAWKYTNLRPIAEAVWTPACSAPIQPQIAVELASARIPGAIEIVFVNGQFAPELSSLGGLEQGVRVTSLRETLSRRSEELESVVGRVCSIEHGPLAALNTAFFQDGLCLELDPGTAASSPIHCLFVSADGDVLTLTSPRLLILAGRQSQATVVETYVGRPGVVGWTNAVTEISIGDAAVLEHYKIQQESVNGYHVGALAVRQNRASSFTSHHVALGAALARTDIDVLFAAEGSDCTLNGLFVGSGTQHLDTHTVIDHAQPHCTSRELYKGV